MRLLPGCTMEHHFFFRKAKEAMGWILFLYYKFERVNIKNLDSSDSDLLQAS